MSTNKTSQVALAPRGLCAHTGAALLLQTCSKAGVAGASASNISVSTDTDTQALFGAVHAPRAEEGDCLTASLCQGPDEPQQLPQEAVTEISGETNTLTTNDIGYEFSANPG